MYYFVLRFAYFPFFGKVCFKSMKPCVGSRRVFGVSEDRKRSPFHLFIEMYRKITFVKAKAALEKLVVAPVFKKNAILTAEKGIYFSYSIPLNLELPNTVQYFI